MKDEKRFLVDVGMENLPFPINVFSKTHAEGQATIATISIQARIMKEFEARWIDKFIQILHRHRETIGAKSLRKNILDYMNALNASVVRVNFQFPQFVEKTTPISKEKCLVRYLCTFSVKVPSLDNKPKVFFKTQIPAITTYPVSMEDKPKGLFGQLSTVTIETESATDIYLEDLIDIVDRHAITPVYAFLTEDDQNYIIEKIHSEKKTSVVMVDEIKEELAHNRNIDWYSVTCSNYGMLHTYNTVIATEKSLWLPFSGYEDSEI
ncbi:MAG: GTP cyclohydrolase, FolE2/MptA family [Fibrobacterota bacterium]